MHLLTPTYVFVQWSPFDSLGTAEWIFIKFGIQELYCPQ
jgi:hypothetical protein